MKLSTSCFITVLFTSSYVEFVRSNERRCEHAPNWLVNGKNPIIENAENGNVVVLSLVSSKSKEFLYHTLDALDNYGRYYSYVVKQKVKILVINAQGKKLPSTVDDYFQYIKIYEAPSNANLFKTLRGSVWDVLVFDICARLQFRYVYPYSWIGFPFLSRAINYAVRHHHQICGYCSPISALTYLASNTTKKPLLLNGGDFVPAQIAPTITSANFVHPIAAMVKSQEIDSVTPQTSTLLKGAKVRPTYSSPLNMNSLPMEIKTLPSEYRSVINGRYRERNAFVTVLNSIIVKPTTYMKKRSPSHASSNTHSVIASVPIQPNHSVNHILAQHSKTANADRGDKLDSRIRQIPRHVTKNGGEGNNNVRSYVMLDKYTESENGQRSGGFSRFAWNKSPPKGYIIIDGGTAGKLSKEEIIVRKSSYDLRTHTTPIKSPNNEMIQHTSQILSNKLAAPNVNHEEPSANEIIARQPSGPPGDIVVSGKHLLGKINSRKRSINIKSSRKLTRKTLGRTRKQRMKETLALKSDDAAPAQAMKQVTDKKFGTKKQRKISFKLQKKVLKKQIFSSPRQQLTRAKQISLRATTSRRALRKQGISREKASVLQKKVAEKQSEKTTSRTQVLQVIDEREVTSSSKQIAGNSNGNGESKDDSHLNSAINKENLKLEHKIKEVEAITIQPPVARTAVESRRWETSLLLDYILQSNIPRD